MTKANDFDRIGEGVPCNFIFITDEMDTLDKMFPKSPPLILLLSDAQINIRAADRIQPIESRCVRPVSETVGITRHRTPDAAEEI